MAWPKDDNKEIVGPKDRIWVSPTEHWELSHFIDYYLKGGVYEVNNKNRNLVKRAISNYPGRSPIKREDLTVYLDRKFKIRP